MCVVDEGYQRRVTVDEEDSTILVYDNWKQVSQALSQMHKNMLRFACFGFFILYFIQWLSEFVAVLPRWECIIKGPLKCFETRSVILCFDVIITETGRQGGTYQAAPPLFKIANSVRLYHSLG